MNFRRYYIPGSTVFITQVVQDRQPAFRDLEHLRLLQETLHNVQAIHPFLLLGYVFLHDHFHLLIQPTGESNFSDVMHSLKPAFTREYKKRLSIPSSQPVKFWQKRFWDHIIRDDRDFENHLHYIHFFKHGIVNDPHDWKQSSYLEWERQGLYPPAFQWKEPEHTTWGE